MPTLFFKRLCEEFGRHQAGRLHIGPHRGSTVPQGGESADVLEWELLRACLIGRNDFWGFPRTRSLNSQVGEGAEPERRGSEWGNQKARLGQANAPVHVEMSAELNNKASCLLAHAKARTWRHAGLG